MILSLFMMLGVVTLVVWDIFIYSPQILEEKQRVLSFCIANGFTDFKYTDFNGKYGFCYKELNDTIQKQDFFITKQGRVLKVNE